VAIATDVTDPASVERAVALAHEAPGGLRVSVTCAGIGTPGKLLGRAEPTSLDAFARSGWTARCGWRPDDRRAGAQLRMPLSTSSASSS
jgi:NAD(P)-dependent dehydrogenase (short-subunit alcohol dehydrogenase family)